MVAFAGFFGVLPFFLDLVLDFDFAGAILVRMESTSLHQFKAVIIEAKLSNSATLCGKQNREVSDEPMLGLNPGKSLTL